MLRLNERGQMLYRILKDGDVPASLDIDEAFTHNVGKWLLLLPLFAKTGKPVTLLLVAVAVLMVGWAPLTLVWVLLCSFTFSIPY
jgi:hypothetical protein